MKTELYSFSSRRRLWFVCVCMCWCFENWNWFSVFFLFSCYFSSFSFIEMNSKNFAFLHLNEWIFLCKRFFFSISSIESLLVLSFWLNHLFVVSVIFGWFVFISRDIFFVLLGPFLATLHVHQSQFDFIWFDLSFFSLTSNSYILLTFRCICFNQIHFRLKTIPIKFF